MGEETQEIVVTDQGAAADVAYRLIRESIQFVCEPLLEDRYLFELKAEVTPEQIQVVFEGVPTGTTD